jgi:hypothetical protein
MTPKRILVPLKGPTGDENVVSIAAAAAREAGGTLRLLHVAPVPHNLVAESGRVVMYADQEMERLDAEWSGYWRGSPRRSRTPRSSTSFGSASRRTRSPPRPRPGERRSWP